MVIELLTKRLKELQSEIDEAKENGNHELVDDLEELYGYLYEDLYFLKMA